MEAQIETDLSYFKGKSISLSQLDALYEEKASLLQLVKYTVRNNAISVDKKHVDEKKYKERIERYFEVLTHLGKTMGLPNTVLLISINDGLNAKEDIPLFAMCKMDSDRIILIPDYEAFGSRFQVLRNKNIDLTKTEFPWEAKLPQLIWRGSTAQRFAKITTENFPLFSRVRLCELGELYPEIIDAKFTIFAQGGDKVPYLFKFKGDRVDFEDQMQYKYHILIDGNVCPYTKSGWKLFTNSLLFKPESKWRQWYFEALQAGVHYIPVKEDLSDLVEKIEWALKNDKESKKIASNCRAFALDHFRLSDHFLYLYHAILRYHELVVSN